MTDTTIRSTRFIDRAGDGRIVYATDDLAAWRAYCRRVLVEPTFSITANLTGEVRAHGLTQAQVTEWLASRVDPSRYSISPDDGEL